MMKNTTLRLTALAFGSLFFASCGSTPPKKETTSGHDLDNGPSRYLQEPSTGGTQMQSEQPLVNADPAAPQTPVTETKPDANTPPAPDSTPTPPVTPAPPAPEPPKPAAELPFGKPVPGKKGFVTSPFDGSAGIIDVRDIAPGTKVRDPYTGKVFRVP